MKQTLKLDSINFAVNFQTTKIYCYKLFGFHESTLSIYSIFERTSKIFPQNLDIAFSGLYLRNRKTTQNTDICGHLRTFADK